MRKQELVQTHALIAEITKYERSRGTTVILRNYQPSTKHPGPTNVAASKTAHEAAIWALLNDLTAAITTEPTDESETKERIPLTT